MRITLPQVPPLPIIRPIFTRRFEQSVGRRGRGSFGFAIFHQFDTLQQAHAAHVADDGMLGLHLLKFARADTRRFPPR